MSENTDRQQKINELAEKITQLMMILDIQFVSFTDEEIELLEETKESLRSKISHNEAAFPMILALGGNYDGELDRLKLDSLNHLITLIKNRRELQFYLRDKRKQDFANKEILKMFGV